VSISAGPIRYKRKRLSKKTRQKLEIDFDSDHETDANSTAIPSCVAETSGEISFQPFSVSLLQVCSMRMF